MTDRLADLSAAGVAVWLDDLSRVRLSSGGLDQLRREQHVVGVTTNPTIFAKALERRRRVRRAGEATSPPAGVDGRGGRADDHHLRRAVGVRRDAAGVRRVDGVDGRVSIEVDPRLAHDTDKTVAEAKALWWLVDRENLFIKIPATEAGLPAITATLAEGISVNVTLIFSLERYRAVMEAFLAGLEQAKANGHDLSKIGSVASFFVSRVDTEIDKRLDKIGSRRGQGAARQGRHRQRPAGVRAVHRGLRPRPLAGAGRRRRPPAAPALGVDLHQEPGLPGRDLRRGTDRAGHRQHHAGVGHHTRSPTTARSAATPSPARTSRPARSSPTWPRSASTSPTWSRSWSARAWRSSRPAGGSCSRASGSR